MQRSAVPGQGGSQDMPLAFFPLSLLGCSRETDFPPDRLTYNAPPEKWSPKMSLALKPSVSADLFGRRSRGWGQTEFPFPRGLISRKLGFLPYQFTTCTLIYFTLSFKLVSNLRNKFVFKGIFFWITSVNGKPLSLAINRR